jgi:hypothetical protein
VTIPEAARRLGLSKSAVRRRLQSGQLTGRREDRPQGHVWLIALSTGGSNGHTNGVVHAPEDLPAGAETSRHVPAGAGTSRQGPAGAAGRSLGTALQRAQEMAAYSEALLAPYVQKIEAQAERIGRLEERAAHLQAERDAARAELEQARLQLSERAEAIAPEVPPPPESAPAPPAPESASAGADRPWWRRAWAWVTADQDDRAPSDRPAA